MRGCELLLIFAVNYVSLSQTVSHTSLNNNVSRNNRSLLFSRLFALFISAHYYYCIILNVGCKIILTLIATASSWPN